MILTTKAHQDFSKKFQFLVHFNCEVLALYLTAEWGLRARIR